MDSWKIKKETSFNVFKNQTKKLNQWLIVDQDLLDIYNAVRDITTSDGNPTDLPKFIRK